MWMRLSVRPVDEGRMTKIVAEDVPSSGPDETKGSVLVGVTAEKAEQLGRHTCGWLIREANHE